MVRRQIEMVRAAADAGLPILGSCWGLQIAAIAGGGMVARNPGRGELGIARKIVPTQAGRDHPLLRGRGAAFDAPRIHYDDVVRLPEGSTLIAGNDHCPVQAAVIPLGRSAVWGGAISSRVRSAAYRGSLRLLCHGLGSGRVFRGCSRAGRAYRSAAGRERRRPPQRRRLATRA